jgi:hypothetical protein
LLAKDAWRTALSNEPFELGPEMSGVFFSPSFPGGAEWLAGTASCPKRLGWKNACFLECKWPATDTGEPVALGVPADFFRFDFPNVPVIYITLGDVSP